ncbi:hypothetical protein HBI42_133860 [Parastagonospora nodorum]|nr:hypothetical protein HBI71_180880 [Parastagonospora nodorum]KAH5396878.1 hypothetical protein HBI47_220600 [Parastagonospora nodorum]KAH6215345.1 hypothetical protein HBI43_133250 [Parastagonospora nodorum]KAH6254201.1 hypothetical protein HBI42_133860 [Parastagonospora nodorum]
MFPRDRGGIEVDSKWYKAGGMSLNSPKVNRRSPMRMITMVTLYLIAPSNQFRRNNCMLLYSEGAARAPTKVSTSNNNPAVAWTNAAFPIVSHFQSQFTLQEEYGAFTQGRISKRKNKKRLPHSLSEAAP